MHITHQKLKLIKIFHKTTTTILKNLKKIEKPWAVYKDIMGCASGVGRVIKEGDLEIEYAERQLYSPAVWDERYVERFDSPIKAMAYFLDHQNLIFENPWTKREVITDFLSNFPSRKKIFEYNLSEGKLEQEHKPHLS